MRKEYTHEEKCKMLKNHNIRVEEYKLWEKMAKEALMTNLIPRIYGLSLVGYTGCGFHYDMEASAGKLLAAMANGPHKLNMNWFEKIGDSYHEMILNEVIFESLCQRVIEAENTI